MDCLVRRTIHRENPDYRQIALTRKYNAIPLAPMEGSMKILQIDSSPLGDASVSRQLTKATVEAWRDRYPQAELVYRDLVADAPEHLTAERLAVIKFGKDSELTPVQAEERALIDAIDGEFLSA